MCASGFFMNTAGNCTGQPSASTTVKTNGQGERLGFSFILAIILVLFGP
jgi:hypothetical protein